MSRRNFFQLTLSLFNVSKIILKTNKSTSDSESLTSGPRDPTILRHQILENSLSEPCAERRPLLQNMFTRRPTKKFFCYPNS